MLKAAAIGAATVYAFVAIDGADKKITSKIPAEAAKFIYLIPGALAGMAAKKWG